MGKAKKNSSLRTRQAGRKAHPDRAEPMTSFSAREGEAWNLRSRRDVKSLVSSVLMVADGGVGQLHLRLEELLGSLHLLDDPAEKFSQDQSPSLWPVVKQMILEKELRDLALTDDLTCLYNRRGFIAAATQQLKFAHRSGEPMTLFCCQVDNLKQINELFGREEGDFALVRAADALEEAFRESDLLARLEGDEFAVLASGASGNHRDAVLRRLDSCLQRASATEPRYPLSVSIGAAPFDPNHPEQLSELMDFAERDMNEHKQRGSCPFPPNLGSH
jgi:diguanylate cyclase (GGDEF)-like protein